MFEPPWTKHYVVLLLPPRLPPSVALVVVAVAVVVVVLVVVTMMVECKVHKLCRTSKGQKPWWSGNAFASGSINSGGSG